MSDRDEAIRHYAGVLAKTLQCNCDLDNWEPTKRTGHSPVCRIHKIAIDDANAERAAAALASARPDTDGAS